MALFGRVREVEVTAAPAVIAKPLALVPHVEKASDVYSEIAAEIGLVSPALTKNKLMAWLSENSVKVYDNAQVYEYLARQIGARGRITWRPLRENDYAGPNWYWSNTSRLASGGVRDIAVCMNNPLYSQPVPLHALRLVRDMEAALGKEVMAFFVSDVTQHEELRLNDPFLAVSTRNNLSDITIVDMWDEPGFGKE